MSTAAPESLRVVLDTNVLVSAFTHQGISFKIWQWAIKGRFLG
jgi:predicted nucleic acid-binding protein